MRIELYNNSIPSNNIKNYNKSHINRANSVSFEGLNISKLIPGSSKAKERYLDDFAMRYGGFIGIDYHAVREAISGVSEKRLAFFRTIADRYNSMNFYLSKSEKENAGNAINLFKSIKNPTKDHFYLLAHVKGSFEDLSHIFELAKDEKSLKFVRKFYSSHKGIPNKEIFIKQILESNNRQHYMAHIDDYKSYIRVNAEDENAFTKLDEMIKAGNFNSRDYDIKLAFKKFARQNVAKSKVFTEQAIKKDYTPEGLKIINKIFIDFLYNSDKLSEKDLEEILKIYKTTSKENFSLRIDVLDMFRNSADISNNQAVDSKEIQAVRQLFDVMDKDKNARKFVEKAVKNELGVSNVQELLEVMSAVPPSKANIFYNNISLLVSSFSGEARYNALVNHLEDPFYSNKILKQRYKASGYIQFYKKEPFYSRAVRYIENSVNKLRAMFSKGEGIKPAAIETQESIHAGNIESISPSIISKNSNVVSPVPFERSLRVVPHTESILEKTLAELTANVQRANEASLNIKKSLKEARQAKRLKVISDINDIIGKKLGKKTYADQVTTYDKKATKIRLSLLPEIFESIKDTRKAQRLAGIRENVSSKDALELYKRINGHNRKLVRYMLSKRNAEGNRIFSIKDIISLIDDSEKQIASNKLADKTFKPKSHYDVIYNEYIEKHGKLPARRKK